MAGILQVEVEVYKWVGKCLKLVYKRVWKAKPPHTYLWKVAPPLPQENKKRIDPSQPILCLPPMLPSFRFVLPQGKWTFEHLLGKLKCFSVVQKAKPSSNHRATGKGRRQDSFFFRKIRQKRLFRDILDTKECFVDMKKVKKIEVLQRG